MGQRTNISEVLAYLGDLSLGRCQGCNPILDPRGSPRGKGEKPLPADLPALVAELQRLLPLLFHLSPQPPHCFLELRVLLPEAASLAGLLLGGALARRVARLARTAPLLGRKQPEEPFAGGAMADKGQRWAAAKTQPGTQVGLLIQELTSSLLKYSALRVGQMWASKSLIMLVSQECGLN